MGQEGVAPGERDDAFWERWSIYLGGLQGMMNLGDWDICFSDGVDPNKPELGEYGASITITENRQVATIYLADDWETFTPEQHRHYLVHELCHVHIDGVYDAYKPIVDSFNLDMIRLGSQYIYQAIERSVDRFAFVIAQFMPTPERFWAEFEERTR